MHLTEARTHRQVTSIRAKARHKGGWTLFYMDGQYKMPFHLEPRATAMFNLLQVVQAHQPDSDGHTIPFFIRQGSAVISGQQGETEQINLVIDAATFNVRTATCDPQCVQWVR